MDRYRPRDQAGDQIKLLEDKISFIWPEAQWLENRLIFDRPRKISNLTLGVSALDANFFSFVFFFQENNFRLLFTGDSPNLILDGLSQKYLQKANILKIPHHGSKNSLTKKMLLLADPELAVISVGKNNPHGHPHREVLDMLQALKIKIKRTDKDGDIVFKINSNVE